jgi:hypothetical protein
MALRLITENNFRQSPYGQMADQIEGRLSDLIAQAENMIEERLGYKVSTASYTEVFRFPKKTTLFLRHRPIATLTSVKRRLLPTDAWTDLDPTTFYVNAGAGYVEDSLGGDQIQGYEVQVIYSAGYALDAVPSSIKQAVIMMTALLAYQDVDVFGGQDKNPPSILYMQKEIDRLLASVSQTRTV